MLDPSQLILIPVRILPSRHMSRSLRGSVTNFRSFFPPNRPPRAIDNNNVSLSQQLLHSIGCISSISPGTHAILPLAQRSLEKLIYLIDQEMRSIGAQRVTLPSLIPSSLLNKSNRLKDMQQDLFSIKEYDGKLLLAPTHEEVATHLMSTLSSFSRKSLPIYLYQIGPKFRNETRPRGGLLRGREFIMKDLYSFDESEECSKSTYKKVSSAYERLFNRLGLDVLRASAHPGSIGGSVSHEYHMVNKAGQDVILICSSCGHVSNVEMKVVQGQRDELRREATMRMSASDERKEEEESERERERRREAEERRKEEGERKRGWRDGERRGGGGGCEGGEGRGEEMYSCPSCHSSDVEQVKGIEVAHTFLLASHYTAPFDVKVADAHGKSNFLHMGCYGIGVSRLLAASVECQSNDERVKWPQLIAPFDVVLVPPMQGAAEFAFGNQFVTDIAQDLAKVTGLDVLIDDRVEMGIGKRDKDHLTRGIPFIVNAGRSCCQSVPKLELINTTSIDPSIDMSTFNSRQVATLHTHCELFDYLTKVAMQLDTRRECSYPVPPGQTCQ